MKTAALTIPILPHTAPPAAQPIKFKIPLHLHQLRALYRCLLIETDGSLSGDFQNRYDYKSRGGVLADAVGMGKTATALGLALSSHKGNGGDTLVVAPGHLIPQWKSEIAKFTDEIEVVVGKGGYEALPERAKGGKDRIVLVDVNDILDEKKVWYDFRRVFESQNGKQLTVSRARMEELKKSALFCVQSPRGPCSYEGWVYTGSLHIPIKHRPWRRVIFDEIQDLVAAGTESQKNLLQLTRSAQNVWLLSATPFPHGNNSVYANHELLGFCRLRMDVEVDYPLHRNHTFEIIKRKLYIRSPRHVADDAVTATKKVTKTTITVNPIPLERKFYELETADIEIQDRGKIFSEGYNSLRQMMVHPQASEKLRGQAHGNKKNANGVNNRLMITGTPGVGRQKSVSSFAKSSLAQAKARMTALLKFEIPNAEKQLTRTRMSQNLAIKIKNLRNEPTQHNPFLNSNPSNTTSMVEREAKAIHEFFCRCPSLDSAECKADEDACFRIIVQYPHQSEYIYGANATSRIIEYFKNDLAPNKVAGLDHYIAVTTHTYKMRSEALQALHLEKVTLRIRIGSLSATVSTVSKAIKNGDKEDDLAAKHGSKTAALVRHLQKIQESGEKAIVFSYWHDTLNLVWQSLKKCHLKTSFCKGNSRSMSKAINDFTNGSVSILLLSSQAKASGANLQSASHVILLDPTGSSAEHGATLEQQAIGRAVRMGQEKAVTVTRFCVLETIEEKLFQQIDNAAAILQKSSNDSNYVCEDANKVLNMDNITEKKEEDDDIEVTGSISVSDRVAQTIASAKEHGEVIEILDSDDDDDGSDGIPPTKQGTPNLTANPRVSVKKELATRLSTSAPVICESTEQVSTDNVASASPAAPNAKKRAVTSEENPSMDKRSKNSNSVVGDTDDEPVNAPTGTHMETAESIGMQGMSRATILNQVSTDNVASPPSVASNARKIAVTSEENPSMDKRSKNTNSVAEDIINELVTAPIGTTTVTTDTIDNVALIRSEDLSTDNPAIPLLLAVTSEENPSMDKRSKNTNSVAGDTADKPLSAPIGTTTMTTDTIDNVAMIRSEDLSTDNPAIPLLLAVTSEENPFMDRRSKNTNIVAGDTTDKPLSVPIGTLTETTETIDEQGMSRAATPDQVSTGNPASLSSEASNARKRAVTSEENPPTNKRSKNIDIVTGGIADEPISAPTSTPTNTSETLSSGSVGRVVSPQHLPQLASRAIVEPKNVQSQSQPCSRIEEMLVDVELHRYTDKFQEMGYDSLKELVDNVNNPMFMEKLVTDVGFSAAHAVRFQMMIGAIQFT